MYGQFSMVEDDDVVVTGNASYNCVIDADQMMGYLYS